MIKIDEKTKILKVEDLRGKGKNNEAIEILKEILKDYPEFPPVLNSLALLYTNLENFEEAELI